LKAEYWEGVARAPTELSRNYKSAARDHLVTIAIGIHCVDANALKHHLGQVQQDKTACAIG
jgi:hypothetical protein